MVVDSNDMYGLVSKRRAALATVGALGVLLASCSRPPKYDVVLRNGCICDGTGAPCVAGGVAINGDTIARVGDLGNDRRPHGHRCHGAR